MVNATNSVIFPMKSALIVNSMKMVVQLFQLVSHWVGNVATKHSYITITIILQKIGVSCTVPFMHTCIMRTESTGIHLNDSLAFSHFAWKSAFSSSALIWGALSAG